LLKDENIANDSLYRYISSGALSYWRAEVVTGTYDALIGSGKTNLIQNNELTRTLAEFSSEIKFGFEDEEFAMNINDLLLEQTSHYAGVLLQSIYSNEKNKELIKVKKEFANNASILDLLHSKITIEDNRLQLQKDLLQYSEDILQMINSDLGLENKKVDPEDAFENEEKEFEEIVLTNEVKEKYIGKYQFSLTAYIHITLENGVLYGRLNAQNRVELTPYEATKFFIKELNDQIEFVLENGEVQALIYKTGGEAFEAKKIN